MRAILALLAIASPEAEPLEMAIAAAVVAGKDVALTREAVEEVSARVARGRVGLRVVRAEAAATSIERCGSDMYCIAGELNAAGVVLGLLVNVNLAFAPYAVDVRLVDQRAGGVVARESGPVAEATDAILSEIEVRVGRVLDAKGHSRGGFIVARVFPEDAVVSIAGPGSDAAEGTLESPGRWIVRPGRWEVRGEKEGFARASAEVEVAAGEELPIELHLAEEGSFFSSPWFWVALGAAVAAGGATAAVIATRPERERCVCVAPPGVPCDTCR